MLVYGDRSRSADPQAELQALKARLDAVESLAAGLERHTGLVAALIACGELAQGLADAAFAARSVDGPDPAADLALQATRDLAGAVVRSWRSSFSAAPTDRSALNRLHRLSLPAAITIKEGEGYAFYALYPETYAEAAAQAPPPSLVIGVRSIGTSLGALVAAATEAARFFTVRPTGHPFRRVVEVDPASRPGPSERIAVVDEGPGLSGSSFGAVLDWLEIGIVSRETLTAFPSHPGDPGHQVSDTNRRRWREIAKPCVGFDEAIAPRLAGWVADLTGPAPTPLQDVSGGGWRTLRYRSEAEWPAVNAVQERRKVLLRSDRGSFLLKFSGLGAIGERKLARATVLSAAGFSLAPLGLRHGFLVEPWMQSTHSEPTDEQIVERLASYLQLRSEQFPSPEDQGASVEQLFTMAEVNVREGLGDGWTGALKRWRGALPGLAAQVRRVITDNRLHPHEWISTVDGQVLKTDALDHAVAHDLVGCQDIAWDVAGAAVEFDLDEDAVARLWREVDGGGAARSAAFLDFHRLAYLAFQLGASSMAVEAHAGWPEEAARLAAARDRYAEKLRRTLSA